MLPVNHVDTDQIIPSREMKRVSREGLGEGLFAGWRYREASGREPVPEFPLNRPEAEGATILVSGENFGCGSSREHAVWALAQYGFRVIIAESFGAIFRGNCIRNGILPLSLPGKDCTQWRNGVEISVDLEAQKLILHDQTVRQYDFDIDPYAKKLLLEGLEPIAMTLSQSESIEEFIERDKKMRPWLYSAA
ncbi:3-isopropylmalate dehydratase small subunit [Parvularcula lutaonensis]|nr:3-isopropylmalate dehydratase small subunit [Parvularcula lutaonensis]